MTLDKKTNVEKNVVELEITVPAEEFEKAVQKSYLKNVKKMNVPGFRRGKAPRKMIEKMYGAEIFYDDAINEVYPGAYEAAVKEAAIEPVDRAAVEIISTDADGFKFKAKVTVKPEVSVKEYKGLKVEKILPSVSAEEVENELKGYQKRQGRIVEVPAGEKTAEGDTVIFDFEGFCDGKAFEGGKAEDFSLVLGSGQFIPGFEEQMVGKEAGSEFSVNVKFPEDYHAEELKGKDAEFKIKLHEIKREELPALDDDFAKDVSDFDTLDEFKKDLEKKILDRKNEQAEREVEAKLSDMLCDILEAEIPSCMFENEIDMQLQNFERRFAAQGISLQQYLEYTGQEVGSLRNMFREQAEKDVKARLALEKIAETEKVIITDDEVNEEYNKFASEMGMDIEKIKSEYMTENIMKDLSLRKAFEAVKNNAEISEVKEAAKPAAKKTAAKKTAAKKTTEKAEEKADEKAPSKKPAAKKTTKAKTETAEAKKPAAKKTTAKKADSQE